MFVSETEQMEKIIHRSEERGFANHGWLKAKHSFSFASWYDPSKIHFGALRVLNDDEIEGGMGFGQHPHDNMEIITIPLSGKVRHRDTMGNHGDVAAGEIQVMSAGTGIQHSEMNPLPNDPLKLFQIWIFPRERNVQPRYDQMSYADLDMNNKFAQLVSPDKNDDGLWIHQDAWIHIAEIDQLNSMNYQIKKEGNGVYLMVIEGEITTVEENLSKRDAIGVWEIDEIELIAIEKSKVLVLEVPMNF